MLLKDAKNENIVKSSFKIGKLVLSLHFIILLDYRYNLTVNDRDKTNS